MSKGVVNRRDKFIWDNSFKPDGQNGGGGGSINYSTDEHVIGTWIDGKPLYEKTYVDIPIPKNSWLATNITANSKIVNVFGYYDTFDSNGNYVTSFNANSIMGTSEHFLTYFSNASNSVSHHWIYSNATTATTTFTIQYTKTTD